MWDRSINEQEVQLLSNCSSFEVLTGSITDWTDINSWELHNVTLRERKTLCNTNSSSDFVIFDKRMPVEKTKHLCRVLGGELPFEYDDIGELRYYDTILQQFEDNVNTQKSPCVSTNGGVNEVKFWIGFEIQGIY